MAIVLICNYYSPFITIHIRANSLPPIAKQHKYIILIFRQLIPHTDPSICLFQASAVSESVTGEETIPILLIAGPTPGVIPCYISVKRPTIKLFAISTFAALCNMIVRVLSGRFLGCFHRS